MKKISSLFISSALISCSFIFPLQAHAISESQKSVISQYCGTIKQSLKTLQHTDIDSRVKLGSRYEAAISKFIIPMNLRVVKNNLSIPELADVQKAFVDNRPNFVTDFTTYSKLLEELISIDCQNDTANFYKKLLETREARESVRKDVLYLNSLLHRYQELVKEMGKDL